MKATQIVIYPFRMVEILDTYTMRINIVGKGCVRGAPLSSPTIKLTGLMPYKQRLTAD